MISRRNMMFGLSVFGISACSGGNEARLGPDGLPLPTAYVIKRGQEAVIQFRMLDSINALRQSAGLELVSLDGSLNAAAATHSHDMSIQNRPWLFGSDGSSPLERAGRAGFPGRLLGEIISESYESELQTLTAWMARPDTRAVILDPNARRMGFAWHQEQTHKLWWTLNMGSDPAVIEQIPGVDF